LGETRIGLGRNGDGIGARWKWKVTQNADFQQEKNLAKNQRFFDEFYGLWQRIAVFCVVL